ncbi:MAG: O-antigen ligase [Pseudomonadota bacterium]
MTRERQSATSSSRTPSQVQVSTSTMSTEKSVEVALRSILFLAVFWFFWISLKAFPDLRDPRVLLPNLGGDRLNQATALLMAGSCAVFAVFGDPKRYLVLASPALVALLLWICISAILSPYPALALKKFVLACLIALQAATLLLLPISKRHFAALITIGIGATLLISYGGVALVPHLAVHQHTELLEPQLAGNWRGSFQHKNEAGTASILMMFFAIFIWRSGANLAGAALLTAAFVFLVGTGSKTPLALFAVTIFVSWMILTVQGTTAKVVLVTTLLAIVTLGTVGSALLPPIHSALQAIGIDATFTDRTSIWSYAIGEAMSRPILGHGFQSFWGTGDVFNSGSSIETWANRASNAHNAYVEAFLTIGAPGLFLILAWLVIQPAADLAKSQSRQADHPLNALFVNIWIYGLFSAALESVFFVGGGPVWITLLLAVFGLRYQASAALATHANDNKTSLQFAQTRLSSAGQAT